MTKSAYCVALTAYKNAPVNWGVGKFLERGKYQKGGIDFERGGTKPVACYVSSGQVFLAECNV